MSAGFFSLGSAADLLVEKGGYTGFAFAPHLVRHQLLGTAPDQSGLELLQSAPLGYRQATLVFTSRDVAERDTVRRYEEAHDQVAFVDDQGVSRQVLVSEFSSRVKFSDVYECTVTMLWITSEVVGGVSAQLDIAIANTVAPTGGDFDVELSWTGGGPATLTLDFDADAADFLAAVLAALGVGADGFSSGSSGGTFPEDASTIIVGVPTGLGVLPVGLALLADNTTGGTDVVITPAAVIPGSEPP